MNNHARVEAEEMGRIAARAERRRAESSEPRESMTAMATAASEASGQWPNHDPESEQDHGFEMLGRVFGGAFFAFVLTAAAWLLWRVIGRL
jgi:hypothetical protein